MKHDSVRRQPGQRGDPDPPFLPFALPDITEEEIAAVTAVLRSGWVTTGPVAAAFEREFAQYLGAQHAVALNSCTAALHLGLEALGVGEGDEILTSTMTFTATAEIAEYLGARSRFVDVAPDTLNMSAGALTTVLQEYVRQEGEWRHRTTGNRLRAIVPVHYAGHPCDMTELLAMAAEYGIPVLDDAAHALPASCGGRRIGTLGRATAFSFYATKTLTTGEGGMLVTDDAVVADRVRLMSLHGISRDAWKRYAADGSWYYEVEEAGYKYNMTDLAAALGRVQLRRVDQMQSRRARIAAQYDQAFASREELQTPAHHPDIVHAWHLYPLRLNLRALRIDRTRFIAELRDRMVGASVHFIPLHRQPFYRERYGYVPTQFPCAEAEYPRLVSLPIYSRMSSSDVDTVVSTVLDIVDRHGA